MSQTKKINRQDLVEKQGSTINLGFPVETADGETANLNGWNARCQIRDIVKDVLLYDVGAAGGMSIDVQNGMVIMHIPSTATEGFNWREGKYDIELFNNDNPPIVIPLVQGKIRLVREATR